MWYSMEYSVNITHEFRKALSVRTALPLLKPEFYQDSNLQELSFIFCQDGKFYCSGVFIF